MMANDGPQVDDVQDAELQTLGKELRVLQFAVDRRTGNHPLGVELEHLPAITRALDMATQSSELLAEWSRSDSAAALLDSVENLEAWREQEAALLLRSGVRGPVRLSKEAKLSLTLLSQGDGVRRLTRDSGFFERLRWRRFNCRRLHVYKTSLSQVMEMTSDGFDVAAPDGAVSLDGLIVGLVNTVGMRTSDLVDPEIASQLASLLMLAPACLAPLGTAVKNRHTDGFAPELWSQVGDCLVGSITSG